MPMSMYATATRADIVASVALSTSSNSSHAGVVSVFVGIYTRNVSTLSLASSGVGANQWTNTSNNSVGSIASIRRLSCAINCNLTPGDYWVAVMSVTSTTNANWFTASNCLISLGQSLGFQGLIGEASNVTKQLYPGLGTFSATTASLPASIAFNQISGHGATNTSVVVRTPPFVQFMNYTA